MQLASKGINNNVFYKAYTIKGSAPSYLNLCAGDCYLSVIQAVMDISITIVPFFPFLNVQQLVLPVGKISHFSGLFCKSSICMMCYT